MKKSEEYPNFKEVGVTEKSRRIFIATDYDEVAIEIKDHLVEADKVKICSKCGAVLSIEIDGEKEKIISAWEWPRKSIYREWRRS